MDISWFENTFNIVIYQSDDKSNRRCLVHTLGEDTNTHSHVHAHSSIVAFFDTHSTLSSIYAHMYTQSHVHPLSSIDTFLNIHSLAHTLFHSNLHTHSQ